MKKIFFVIAFAVIALLPFQENIEAAKHELKFDTAVTKHNWKEYSTEYNEIEVGSHEYTYWKNFIRQKRTCNISHKVKTVVYYCDLHDHTKSETFLEEIVHSEKHRDEH